MYDHATRNRSLPSIVSKFTAVCFLFQIHHFIADSSKANCAFQPICSETDSTNFPNIDTTFYHTTPAWSPSGVSWALVLLASTAALICLTATASASYKHRLCATLTSQVFLLRSQ